MEHEIDRKQRSKILIVDDNPANIGVVGDMLKETGEYALSVAKDGKSAVRMARKVMPDLILLDIVMNGMDGYRVCEILKASPETRHIPVIFQTAERAQESDIVRGFEVGGADYLTKPIGASELLARVRTHLALKQAHKTLRESEQRYRAVVEDMAELVCRFLPGGALLFVNDAYCRFFAKSREQLLGTSFLELVPEQDRKKARRHLAKLTPNTPFLTSEHRVENARGQVRWLQWTDRAVFDERGAVKEIQSVGRDITDRVHAEQACKNLVEHSLQGMTIFQEGRCVFANRRMEEIAGLQEDAFDSMTVHTFVEMLHPGDWEKIAVGLHVEGAGEQGQARQIARLLRKDGEVRWLDVHFAYVRYWGNPSVQMAVMDITRVRELETIFGRREMFRGMVGASLPMQRVYTLVEQIAPTDLAVLATGETGTGKELLVEALHMESRRAGGPLVRVNCAELPENLVESELFGHARGAFTGADRDRDGRFQAADGGTLFLDEIGDLPLHIQTKLLRFIETREIQRLGDSSPRKANIRVIAATNADLQQRVAEGEFREDLFFRLKGAHIHLPLLRERGNDILALFEHFRDRFCERNRKGPIRLRKDIPPLLLAYSWPGNVRELKNAAEWACSVCDDAIMTPDDLPEEIREQTSPLPMSEDEAEIWVVSDEERRIRRALEKTRWHKGLAAKKLGIGRTTLYRKLARYGIDKEAMARNG